MVKNYFSPYNLKQDENDPSYHSYPTQLKVLANSRQEKEIKDIQTRKEEINLVHR